MKNMKVAYKLILAFSIIGGLCTAVGAVGIYGMKQITNADSLLYEEQTKPLPDIAKILEYAQQIRVQARDAIIYSGNMEKLKTIEAELTDCIGTFELYLTAYGGTIKDPESRKAFDEAVGLYKSSYRPCVEEVLKNAKLGADPMALIVMMENVGSVREKMDSNFTLCMTNKVAGGETASINNDLLYTKLLLIIIIVIAVALAAALWLTYYISGMISKPLVPISSFLKKASETGDLTLRPEDERNIAGLIKIKDEIGLLSNSLVDFLSRIHDVSKALETIADGDLTTKLALLSEKDSMGLSLQRMIENLNSMFDEINVTSGQVATAAQQIADGAQSLAQCSTEQASAIEELSASTCEIAEKTKWNANIAKEAAVLSGTIKNNAEKGNEQMDQMMQAVREINEASNQINKVIKVIDDIAFQTNILALNAAVEAARAGQHGKGFAVVAEEVRNLAAKSAEAAKDTGELIENSIEKANLGLNIAIETSASLGRIVEGINRSAEIVTQIARSSDEQAESIAQMNTAIDQVAQVVQQNSATAEESAAASQEMSGQSELLAQLISQFKLRKPDNRLPTSFISGSR